MKFIKVSDTEATLDGDIYPSYDYWTGDSMSDASIAELSQFLSDSKGGKVTVNVNSFGGVIYSANAIGALIRSHGKVTMKAIGLVASAGTLVLLSAKTVEMDKYAQIMIHEARGGAFGTSKEMRNEADQIDALTKAAAQLYADKALSKGKGQDNNRDKTVQYFDDLMKSKDVFLSAEQALEMGLVDKVVGGAANTGLATNTLNKPRFEQWQALATDMKNKGFAAQYAHIVQAYQPEQAADAETPSKGWFATIKEAIKEGVSDAFAVFKSELPKQVAEQPEQKAGAPENVQTETNFDNQTTETEMTKEETLALLSAEISPLKQQLETQKTEAQQVQQTLNAELEKLKKDKQELEQQLAIKQTKEGLNGVKATEQAVLTGAETSPAKKTAKTAGELMAELALKVMPQQAKAHIEEYTNK